VPAPRGQSVEKLDDVLEEGRNVGAIETK
jgi:hypothetical protein